MHQQSHASRRTPRAAAAGLLALVASLLVLPSEPAVADSTYLCTGYQGCADKGYSHAGYKGAGDQMYWRMYAGHNCTNYVAYRMVKNGMPNTRPWSGEGDADNWGRAMASITDQTPMVGAVAWWKANTPGAGSSGHVAYVERVVSSTEIVISEDSWGGDFHWRTIVKSGRGWPSGFVHFNDQVLAPTTPPSIVGTPQVGVRLTANQGTWNPAGSYAYQWAAGGTPIAGATARTYVPTAAVRFKKLTVTVTASKKGFQPGRAAVTSATSVRPGTFANTAVPVISGTAQVDETLRVTAGGWSPAAASRTVQWYADGAAIPGATAWTLVLGQAQIDKRITARVSVKSDGYTKATAAAAPTAPVLAGTIAEVTPYAVAGTTAVGKVLTVRPGTLDPADATVRYTWLRDGVPVAGATGETYPLGPQDVGSRIALRLDFTRRSYRSLTRTIEVPGVVTTRPELKVAAKGKPGRAIVQVRLAAPGIDRFDGKVLVKVGSRTVEVRVVDGRARVVVPDLSHGKKKVRVRYAGTSVIKPVAEKITVRVPRK